MMRRVNIELAAGVHIALLCESIDEISDLLTELGYTYTPTEEDLRYGNAETTILNIPDWATWTQSDWATWRDDNISSTQINGITNLTEAKVVLNKMSTVIDKIVKMELALRDRILPWLPDV